MNIINTKVANHRVRGIIAQNRKRNVSKVFNKNFFYKSKYFNFILSRTPKKKAQMLNSREREKRKYIKEDKLYVKLKE